MAVSWLGSNIGMEPGSHVLTQPHPLPSRHSRVILPRRSPQPAGPLDLAAPVNVTDSVYHTNSARGQIPVRSAGPTTRQVGSIGLERRIAMAPRRKRPPLAHSVGPDREHHGFHGYHGWRAMFAVVRCGFHPCPSVASVVKPKAVRPGTGANGDPRSRVGNGCAGISGFIRSSWLSSALGLGSIERRVR